MSHSSLLLLLTLLSFSKSDLDDNKPHVTTPLGEIRGYSHTSHGGRKISVFEGIPYAKPPVNERRFEEPEPVEPWNGVWNAIFLTQCGQTGMLKPGSIDGEEDCLYLNVYVPRENPDPESNLDVIVHIHGGAFMYGSGHSYAHPEYLMDREIILVTLNYRLGIFGFLSTEDDVVPGNNGLKDQVLALKWIQKNIASFGGNPDSVTLTGLSAGGASVEFHYLSEMSRGLFHRGFSQSGVALNSFAIQENALDKVKLLGNSVGCEGNSSQVLVECLKQRHYKHLLGKVPLLYGYLFMPVAPFAPVIEKGPNPFLNKNPYELLVNGQVLDLPWMVSNVAHEGMLPGAFLMGNVESIDEDWEELAPIMLDFLYTLPEASWKDTAKKIKEFYFGEHKITEENFMTLIKLFSDRLYVVDAEIAAKLHAKVSPVYYYYFNFPSDYNPDKTVAHADDAQYLFYNMFHRQTTSPNELQMKEVVLDLLVSFAKTGKPNVNGVNWEPTAEDSLTYLNISGFDADTIKLEKAKELGPKSFWKSLGILENENFVSVKNEL